MLLKKRFATAATAAVNSHGSILVVFFPFLLSMVYRLKAFVFILGRDNVKRQKVNWTGSNRGKKLMSSVRVRVRKMFRVAQCTMYDAKDE